MKTGRRVVGFGVAIGLLMFVFAQGQDGQKAEEIGIPSGIVWYGVLSDGLNEARETGKPILLLSAAPNCVGVSGIW